MDPEAFVRCTATAIDHSNCRTSRLQALRAALLCMWSHAVIGTGSPQQERPLTP